MLVLSRKKGESIIIGDGIEITVLASEGETIKIGITAPKHVEIYRKEIYADVKQSNLEALNKGKSAEGLNDFLRKTKN
jgi:carbon storage regulator